LSGAPAAATRGTIYSETAAIAAHTGYEGAQYVLRLLAPRRFDLGVDRGFGAQRCH